jgi:hypothetical protein
MWNQYATKLRQRTSDEKFDLLEFNWGYEDPVRKRSVTNDFDLENANETCWKKWDQVDVRMYYFHLAMKKRGWEEAAHGMWYLQDYIDFFDALRNLVVESAPSDEGHCTCLDVGPNMSDLAYQQVQGVGSLRNYAKDVESYHVSMACLHNTHFKENQFYNYPPKHIDFLDAVYVLILYAPRVHCHVSHICLLHVICPIYVSILYAPRVHCHMSHICLLHVICPVYVSIPYALLYVQNKIRQRV